MAAQPSITMACQVPPCWYMQTARSSLRALFQAAIAPRWAMCVHTTGRGTARAPHDVRG
jgi:hypothetical protein